MIVQRLSRDIRDVRWFLGGQSSSSVYHAILFFGDMSKIRQCVRCY